jgi:hypothetical protein|tara:strand:- start:92 stop:328 length:237 start_codon:yes stop_codon:yes gene_type:complete
MTRYRILNGVRVQFTAEEETQRDADEAQALAEQQANAYKRKRAKEYPSIADQLDDIYHNGIDGWKATIKVTKDKYPKP